MRLKINLKASLTVDLQKGLKLAGYLQNCGLIR